VPHKMSKQRARDEADKDAGRDRRYRKEQPMSLENGIVKS